ncbi:MAG: hypothetical protein K0U74_11975 [Alphaproteobacteria bacterium]|nr:hypothetical protein [Alphaproteobacteria bacterium]
MTNTSVKSIAIKFIGSNRPAETVEIEAGTSVADVLKALGLGAGFHLTDPSQPEAVFRPADNLFSRVKDGDMLAVTSVIDAGLEQAA